MCQLLLYVKCCKHSLNILDNIYKSSTVHFFVRIVAVVVLLLFVCVCVLAKGTRHGQLTPLLLLSLLWSLRLLRRHWGTKIYCDVAVLCTNNWHISLLFFLRSIWLLTVTTIMEKFSGASFMTWVSKSCFCNGIWQTVTVISLVMSGLNDQTTVIPKGVFFIIICKCHNLDVVAC
jgi:hypothetical protein